MQTFLPYPDFVKSARCLDNKRLGKQRVECLQILNVLTGKSTGWRNHPAVKMWAGSEWWLRQYGLCICNEWIYRGFKDTCFEKLYNLRASDLSDKRPSWLGDERLHASHRANLLRKDPVHYGKFGWTESPDLPYYWPVK